MDEATTTKDRLWSDEVAALTGIRAYDLSRELATGVVTPFVRAYGWRLRWPRSWASGASKALVRQPAPALAAA